MPVNKLSYVDYDFEELVRQLQSRLRARDSWKDVYMSATGQTLIELYSYVANLMLYYVERRAEECYLSTAQNKSSVINLVQLLGYRPKRNISAVGRVQFSVTTPVEDTLFIDRYTRIATGAGLEFVTTEQGTISKGAMVSDPVRIVQGTREVRSIDSVGALNQEVLVDSTTVENNTHVDFKTIRVFVGEREWTEVPSFLRSGAGDHHYVVRDNLDDTITIVFGDNVRGAAPASGQRIRIEYISSRGNDGNVYELDKVDVVMSPSVSFDYVEDDVPRTGTRVLSVTNISAVTGGSDRETVEEIREEAPAVFRTGDRLVVRSDFEAVLKNTENIVEVLAWGENEELRGESSNFEMFNVVKIVLLLQGWQHPLQDTEDRLEDLLYQKSLMTVKYEFVPAQEIELVPMIDVVVKSQYALSVAQAEVLSLLQSQFVLGKTAKFGKATRVSNLIEKVDSLEPVKYLYMTLSVRQELTEEETSGEWSAVLKTNSIKPGSVLVYDGTTLIGRDFYDGDSDLVGEFSSDNEDYTLTGTVDYGTKELSVEITPAPSGEVSVRFQQDEGGDVVVENAGICKLHSVDFVGLRYGN